MERGKEEGRRGRRGGDKRAGWVLRCRDGAAATAVGADSSSGAPAAAAAATVGILPPIPTTIDRIE